MKLQMLLFFAFASPIVLFLAIILYGGISTVNIKKALAESDAYSQVSAHFTKQDANVVAQNKDFAIFINRQLTADYIKTKTESVIDDSANWITGKTQRYPVISFKELKDALELEHPNILRQLEYTPTEAALKASNLNSQEQVIYLKQTKQLAAFTNADFMLPLGSQLETMTIAYRILQIALPIIIAFLLCSLFLLINLANSLPLKYKWVGAALMTSSIVGYGAIFFHPYITTAIVQSNVFQESDLFSLFSPIITAIINHYVEIFVGYQKIVNTVFLVGAAGCFLGALLTRKQAVPKIKMVYETLSYWDTPLKEKPTPPSEESKEIASHQ